MANQSVASTPLLGLIRELRDETKNLLQQEVQLAKTELSEKASHFGKNAGLLAVGGFIAYAALIVLLAAVGMLTAFGLERAGLEPSLAIFAGLGIIALIVGLAGFLLLMKGLKTMKHDSLAPQRTIQTLQQLAGGETKAASVSRPRATPAAKTETKPEDKQSSKDLQTTVTHTQVEMEQRMQELGRRMRPDYVGAVVKGQVRTNPLRSVAMAFGTGLASALILVRRSRRARL